MYRVGEPTRLSGVSIPRTAPVVYIVTDTHGRRVDSFLKRANANAAVLRYNVALMGNKQPRNRRV